MRKNMSSRRRQRFKYFDILKRAEKEEEKLRKKEEKEQLEKEKIQQEAKNQKNPAIDLEKRTTPNLESSLDSWEDQDPEKIVHRIFSKSSRF